MAWKKKKPEVQENEEVEEAEVEEAPEVEEEVEEPPKVVKKVVKKVVRKVVKKVEPTKRWTIEEIPTQTTPVLVDAKTGEKLEIYGALVEILNILEDFKD